jgi:hypothetical protein
MRKRGFLLFIQLLLATTAAAAPCPDRVSSAARASVVGDFDSGTFLTAKLVNNVTAHSAWYRSFGFVPIPKVVARIDYDVVCNGKTVIPKGSKLIGLSLDGNLRDSTHPKSSVRVLFTTLQISGQRTKQFWGRLAAVAAPQAPPLDVTSVGVSGLRM